MNICITQIEAYAPNFRYFSLAQSGRLGRDPDRGLPFGGRSREHGRPHRRILQTRQPDAQFDLDQER